MYCKYWLFLPLLVFFTNNGEIREGIINTTQLKSPQYL